MVKTLVFATNNRHKLEEVQALVGPEITLKTLNDIGCTDDIPETGNTFEANASQKSHFIFQRYGMDCFGDDSGLEVEALGGEPGVYSARYSGSRDAEKNLQLVLHKMKGELNRKARFRTIISLLIHGGEHFFEGAIEGTIINHSTGSNGFGYDPIFQPGGYETTFAEMALSEKNRISHRAKAIKKLVDFLQGI